MPIREAEKAEHCDCDDASRGQDADSEGVDDSEGEPRSGDAKARPRRPTRHLRRNPEPHDREREPDVGQQHAMSVLAKPIA